MQYSIGEFAIMTGFSPKTLRYYDEIGILKPADVNASNGYRQYDEFSISRAERLLIWKEVGFSLEEIRGIMDTGEEVESTLKAIERQITALEGRSDRLAAAKDRLQEIATELRGNEIAEPSRGSAPGGSYMTLRFEGGREGVGTASGRLYEAAAKLGYTTAGTHEAEFNEEDCTRIYVRLPIRDVDQQTLPGHNLAADGISFERLPPFIAVSIEHTGSFTTLPLAYQKLRDWFVKGGIPTPRRYLERYSIGRRGMNIRISATFNGEGDHE